ncbi:adenosylcobinamide-phosphate synthase CbiB [Halovivax sp.]|uniref:adenosylcobinamide-phosphate synthase CbiB n=1 Tax=Halovivax sp. TaxID=1935978 RepID=UPI0025C1A915|nr:adenosylcobinamide-phosphate synthase CbiB [Halovivax sp.]
MTLTAVVAIGIAFALEYAIGEPPRRAHPVAWLGRVIAPVDASWSRPVVVGALAAAGIPLATGILIAGVVGLAATIDPLFGSAVAGIMLFVSTSLRMLLTAAHDVILASETDPRAAREALPTLVGRDPSTLSAAEARSAAVESAAENLADGLVAPLLAFALLAPMSLPLGAGAAAVVKAVNTMDSMIGYPNRPVGRAAARLDDLVMWIPTRVSAVLLAAAAVDPGSLRRARRWAHEPASPNSGWPMATLATVLGVPLEKPGAYVLNPVGSLPTVADAERGVALVGRAGLLGYPLAAAPGVIAWL